MIFAKRTEGVGESVTLAITSRAKAMQREGKKVVVLAAGEPDFDTPQTIKDAAIKAINNGVTKYTPSGGTLSLKEAVCRKFKADNGLDYTPDQVLVSNGAKHSLYNIFQVICDRGDEVLIINPYWLSYPEMVKLAEGVPKYIKTSAKNGFRATAEDVRGAITPKTKALVINSPSNPAGVVYGEKDIAQIVKVCLEKKILIISDEIYEKIIFDGQKHISPASLSAEAYKNTVVVNGVSKSYSMTGWRIGYMAGPKEIIKKADDLQSHSTSNPCSISQAASEFALKADLSEMMAKSNKMFQERRDEIMKLFSGCRKIKPFSPSGAFYMFCDISATGMGSIEFAEKLLEEKSVAVIPGKPFGEDGFVRLSFAADMGTIKEGIERIKDWVE